MSESEKETERVRAHHKKLGKHNTGKKKKKDPGATGCWHEDIYYFEI